MLAQLLCVALAGCALAQVPGQQQQYQQQPGQQQHVQQGQQQQYQQQQQAGQQQQYQQQPGQAEADAAAAAAAAHNARQFQSNQEVHDGDHIAQHLNGQMEADTSKMTPEQLQFHYFTMHDLDKDQRLDGIELIKAITHWHGDENNPNAAPPKMSDQELEDMIDSILKDDDFNNDGYIDYPEFLKSQAARAAEQPPPPPPAPAPQGGQQQQQQQQNP